MTKLWYCNGHVIGNLSTGKVIECEDDPCASETCTQFLASGANAINRLEVRTEGYSSLQLCQKCEQLNDLWDVDNGPVFVNFETATGCTPFGPSDVVCNARFDNGFSTNNLCDPNNEEPFVPFLRAFFMRFDNAPTADVWLGVASLIAWHCLRPQATILQVAGAGINLGPGPIGTDNFPQGVTGLNCLPTPTGGDPRCRPVCDQDNVTFQIHAF